MLPLATITLLASKPVTDSLKVNVKVTAALATPATLLLMVRVGARISTNG